METLGSMSMDQFREESIRVTHSATIEGLRRMMTDVFNFHRFVPFGARITLADAYDSANAQYDTAAYIVRSQNGKRPN